MVLAARFRCRIGFFLTLAGAWWDILPGRRLSCARRLLTLSRRDCLSTIFCQGLTRRRCLRDSPRDLSGWGRHSGDRGQIAHVLVFQIRPGLIGVVLFFMRLRLKGVIGEDLVIGSAVAIAHAQDMVDPAFDQEGEQDDEDDHEACEGEVDTFQPLIEKGRFPSRAGSLRPSRGSCRSGFPSRLRALFFRPVSWSPSGIIAISLSVTRVHNQILPLSVFVFCTL